MHGYGNKLTIVTALKLGPKLGEVVYFLPFVMALSYPVASNKLPEECCFHMVLFTFFPRAGVRFDLITYIIIYLYVILVHLSIHSSLHHLHS